MTDLHLLHLRTAAALTGAFRPDALLDSVAAPATARDDLLAALASLCDERIEEDGWFWQLAPDPRRTELRRLRNTGALQSALGRSPPVQSWDGFGQSLQQLLRDEVSKPPERNRGEDRGDALQRKNRFFVNQLAACEFAAEALGTDHIAATKAHAQRQIKLLERSRAVQFVLPTRLFGRDGELDRLYNFLRGKTYSGRSAMLLTGIGGAGKSAVLAHLIDQWQRRSDAPRLIHLDFDRQILRTGEPIRIAAEIIRQLMAILSTSAELENANHPAIEAGLRDLRRDIRLLKIDDPSATFLSQTSKLSSYVSAALDEPWGQSLATLKIALIMDSFEAVGPADGPAVRSVIGLQQELAKLFPNLKTVISGRGVPMSREAIAQQFGYVLPRVHLAGLKPGAGADMLAAYDTAGFFPSDNQRRQASTILKGHPLALIVLGRYVKHLSAGTDPEELLTDLEHEDDFQAEFAHVFLFSRILDRIQDPEVAQLAHPGLVLRRLNPDLIRLILARPCLDRDVTPEEAKGLLHQFAEEYWLVEPAEATTGQTVSPYDLRHQPDVRRPMVLGLFANPRDKSPTTRHRREEAKRRANLSAKARQVAETAAAFYENGPPASDPAFAWWSNLPETERAAEAIYYKALAGHPPSLDLDEAQVSLLREVLGEDLETLNKSWSDAIKVLEGTSVSQSDESELSLDLASTNRKMRQEALSKTGDFSSAFSDTFDEVFRDNASVEDLGLELSNAFDGALFDDTRFVSLCEDYLGALQTDWRPNRFNELRQFHDHPLWKAALFQVALPKPGSFWRSNQPDWTTDAKEIQQADPKKFMTIALHRLVDPWDVFRGSQTPMGSAEDNRREIAKLTTAFGGSLFRDSQSEPANVRIFANGLCLATSDAAPTQPQSIDDLFSGLEDEDKRLIRPLIDLLPHPASPQSSLSVRDIDRAYGTNSAMVTFSALDKLHQHNPQLANRLIRGRNPELLPPATSILTTLSKTAVSRIADRLASRNRLWPESLRFSKSNPYRDIHAANMVDMADKFGLFREFCKELSEYDDRAHRLVTFYDQITRWFFGPLEIYSLEGFG